MSATTDGFEAQAVVSSGYQSITIVLDIGSAEMTSNAKVIYHAKGIQ